jgi:hypothetical protein
MIIVLNMMGIGTERCVKEMGLQVIQKIVRFMGYRGEIA